MRKFFSPLKALGQYLRFLFLTGISKFSQMSIFSELNNLQNISMGEDYSAICGITNEELHTQLKTDIEKMAQANNETYEEACTHLKKLYDGYHFSKQCADIYNPLFRSYTLAYPNEEVKTGFLEALAQINSKGYAIPYQADHRRVVKIGVNFDSATRTVGGWIIEADER